MMKRMNCKCELSQIEEHGQLKLVVRIPNSVEFGDIAEIVTENKYFVQSFVKPEPPVAKPEPPASEQYRGFTIFRNGNLGFFGFMEISRGKSKSPQREYTDTRDTVEGVKNLIDRYREIFPRKGMAATDRQP